MLHEKIRKLKIQAPPMVHLRYETGMKVDAKGALVEETRTMKGYLCVWGVRDTYGTMFMKGCCTKSIRERGPESNSKYKIVMEWMHDFRDPIGRFTVLKEDDYGLYFEAELDEVPNGDRALLQVRKGTLNQFSIGFDYVWDKMEYDEDNDVILLKEIELFEGSVVTRGSVGETYAIRSDDDYENEMEILQMDTEEFIKTIPRKQQIELREIITRHMALARLEPSALRHKTLDSQRTESQAAGNDSQQLSNLLNCFE